jgi:hypothetical protein
MGILTVSYFIEQEDSYPAILSNNSVGARYALTPKALNCVQGNLWFTANAG